MELKFYKYHGNGNDFIVTDNRLQIFTANNQSLIKNLCNRNFGIGADGMILLEDVPGFDFYMRYYNSDGKEGSMCGNGGRCIVHFAREIGIIGDTAIFSGIDGRHEAKIDSRGLVNLKMQNIEKVERDNKAYLLNTGSPHYVLFIDNLSDLDVVKMGSEIRNSSLYKKQGINVNFVQTMGERINIRTYERGVENETLACGTGSIAAAISTVLEKGIDSNTVKIVTRGGELEVSFRQTDKFSFSDIWLTGPAKLVFRGNIDTDNFY